MRFTADNSNTHKKHFDNDIKNADGVITGSVFKIISSPAVRKNIDYTEITKGTSVALRDETINHEYFSQHYQLLKSKVDSNLYPKIKASKQEQECFSFLTKCIYDNKIVLLSGKYGSGKTTILSQLIRLQPQGTINLYIDANDLTVSKGHICDYLCRKHMSGDWKRNSFEAIITALEESGCVTSILIDHSEKLEAKHLDNLIHDLIELYKNLPDHLSLIITGTGFNPDLLEYLSNETVVGNHVLEACMCPLPVSAIKNRNIHLIDPTPFEAWIANTSRADGLILNRFELYRTYYEKLLTDNVSPYGRKFCKYLAWYERVNDGLPKAISSLEIHARENFPSYFANSRISQDYYFDLIQCGLISPKINGYCFANIDARDYLASQFIADIIVNNDDLNANEFIDESQDLIKSVTLLMNSNSVRDVVSSNAHAFGEYVFRSLSEIPNSTANNLSLLKLGLAVGYYSKYSTIEDIRPYIDKYLESNRNYTASDIEIISEINDYLYEILTREYTDDDYKLNITEYILHTLLKCADILAEVAIDHEFSAEFDKCEMSYNGTLFQIVSSVEADESLHDFKEHTRLGVLKSLSDIDSSIYNQLQSAFSMIKAEYSHPKSFIFAALQSVIYGNIGACYLELGVKCKRRKKASDIKQAEYYHLLGLYGRTHSTGNVIRSLICLGTDCYHLSCIETAEQLYYLEKAVLYYDDAENVLIEEARKAISIDGKDENLSLLSYVNRNDDYVTICRNKLGCLFALLKLMPDGKEYGNDKRTYQESIYDLTIKTIESMAAYCEHAGNSVSFIEKTVIDFANRLQSDFIPLIKNIYNKDRLSGRKTYIDMNLIEFNVDRFCKIHNQLETVTPIESTDLL